ncbi:MAG TPA: phosphotransferase [Candidatus Dormibacteraeota bacterium]|nr:phosphotransferase [Candidatus Dormibacteraeota bacterium]
MRPNISDAELLSFLRRLHGRQVHIQPLAEGVESRACAYTMGGDAFILRVGAAGPGFRKDHLAYHRFGSALVPVPEVVALGPYAPGLEYCISRRLPGFTLQDAPSAVVEATLDVTLEAMLAIWATDISFTAGFGVLDDVGRAPSATWRSYLEGIVGDRTRYLPAAVGAENSSRVLHCLAWLMTACPEDRQLIHGDFGANNLLTDGLRITGVLDWDVASCGDPLWDVATALFWATWLPCFERLEQHCRRRLGHLAAYRERVLCYALIMGVGEATGSDTAIHDWAARRCLELLSAA